ncbi:MAG TPA: glycosyltransferase [bacterium]|nr:glycosyltransferase [bacterium]
MEKSSVVIRTFNEAAHLRRTLTAVFAQRDVAPEVIVVDSGSTDDTPAIAREFPVTLIELPYAEFSYGRALNRGFAAATAPVVVSLSAHALPLDRHWLRNLVRPLVDERVAGVVGKTLPHPDCNPFDRRGLLRQYGVERRHLAEGNMPTFSNANSAVRRAVWAAEPFDESLPYSEDALWARRQMGQGRALVYAPDAAVYHSHNETVAQLRRRFWNESRARERIDPHNPRFAGRALATDLLAGTLYDWWTILRTRASLFWYVFAVRRRWAINVGRYCGARHIALPARGWAAPALLKRWGLRLLRLGGSLAGRLAPRVVRLTRKHARPIHPKHLLPEGRDHFWYADELAGGTTVLDVGCNVGAHTAFAAKKGLRVIGFDIDRRALAHARYVLGEQRAQRALVLRASAEETFPVADASCDRVLAFDVIEHLRDPDHLLAEIDRVLCADGLLLLTAPNAETTWKKRYRAAGLDSFADPTHLVEYTRAGLRETLAAAGFAVVREEPIVLDTPLAPWYDLLGACSLRLYARLADRKRQAALAHPDDSTGWRLVARKASA